MQDSKSTEEQKAAEVAKKMVDPETEKSTQDNSNESQNTESTKKDSTISVSVSSGKTKKPLLITLVVLLILGAGVASYLIFFNKKNTQQDSASNNNNANNATEIQTSLVPIERLENPTTGEVWYKERKLIESLKLLDDEQSLNAKYYEMGTRGTNKIIMLTYEVIGEVSYLFERGEDGKTRYIVYPNPNILKENSPKKDTEQNTFKNAESDINTHYDSLSYPKYIDIGNNERISIASAVIGKLETITKPETVKTFIKQYGQSGLYKTKFTYADTGLTSISYKMLTPIGTEIDYAYGPAGPTEIEYDDLTGNFMGNYESSKDFKWDNGVVSTDDIKGVARGCSLGVSMTIAEGLTDADFVKAGTNKAGANLYDFKDKNNIIFQKGWKETREAGQGGGGSNGDISIEEYARVHALFGYKSPNNGWLIYSRNDYGPSYGCAKPVVYLYPKTAQNVSVKVGADVTISDPYYDQSKGWNAFAEPNGQLTVNGKKYGYLFWEGLGTGDYPSISSGTVVKREDADKTIRAQLVQQNLNSQEIKDFMDFWGDKIPKSPYVRLTWFTTAEMDRLAPLTINPKPDTVIRVFLDMAGFDSKINIPTQKLSSVPRNGFTVVEWGGLAVE